MVFYEEISSDEFTSKLRAFYQKLVNVFMLILICEHRIVTLNDDLNLQFVLLVIDVMLDGNTSVKLIYI